MSTTTEANRLLAKALNIGINLGGAGDERWCVDVTGKVLDDVKKAGFTAVRLAVQWARHCQQEPSFTIDPVVLTKVDAAVNGATERGLAAVVTNMLDPELMKDPRAYKNRFLAITTQIARHYKTAPETVLLEPMAEPREQLDALWNEYFASSLRVIREENPTRGVVVGPCSYNNARKLAQLQLPEDDHNLIVTIHHYWPLNFTMQGETWFRLPWFMRLFLGNPKSWPGTTWEDTPRQRAVQKRVFDTAANWAKAHNRPLFVGEFGASATADMPSKVRFARAVRQLCDERGFSWGYWSYGPSFPLYDFRRQQWHGELVEALTTDS